MGNPIHHIVAFELQPGYSIRLEFDDGLVRTIDFEPILHGELYGPLRDPGVFRAVRLDPGFGTLVWPNDADFDPTMLHDWPENEQAFMRMVRGWKSDA